MKTAIQELIETLESQGLEMFGMEEFLEKERQQIIDAANHGANFDTSPYCSADEYYEKTFKND
jgi:hypothetical protein